MRALLALIYGTVIKARNWLYDYGVLKSFSVKLPVVSVGNISAGGNGKTPLVMFIIKILREAGLRSSVLMRGYGGREAGPLIVDKSMSASQVGDEACMYKQHGFDVVVAKNRVAGAILIDNESLAEVIVLDDGFQHRRLRRKLDILSINIASENDVDQFIQAKLLPDGLLREDLTQALERADAFVFALRSSKPKNFQLDRRLLSVVPKSKPIFVSYLTTESIINTLTSEALANRQICALCAIANPEGFFLTLESNDLTIEKRFVFKDHYQFNEADIEKILSQANGLPVVCTAKDSVKLAKFAIKNLFVLKTQQQIEPEQEFREMILATARLTPE